MALLFRDKFLLLRSADEVVHDKLVFVVALLGEASDGRKCRVSTADIAGHRSVPLPAHPVGTRIFEVFRQPIIVDNVTL